MLDRTKYELEFDEDFAGSTLNEGRWLPYYLPHWSSREQSRARYSVEDNRLLLRVDPDQPPWCPEFDGGLRVSNLQTGVFSGPVGSDVGQHRFRPEVRVREAQPESRLYTPQFGLFEIRARAVAHRLGMVAFWMIGFEEHPQRSAEICIMEIFGKEVTGAGSSVGMGVHPFGDPQIHDEFEKILVTEDVLGYVDYAAEWLPDAVHFYINDVLVKSVDQSPQYPMQFMVDVFKFPGTDNNGAADEDQSVVFSVDHVRGWRPLA